MSANGPTVAVSPDAGVAGVAVIGASAGGVEALSDLVATLPDHLAGAVLVVLHVAPSGTSVLPQILARAGRVPVRAASDGEPLQAGVVYVAPVDHHMLVDDSTLRLLRGPRENGHRPAIDPTMRSVAQAYGDRAIAVVMSGTRDDGTAGAIAIERAGGRVVVQDPEEAHFGAMPRSALEHAEAAAVMDAHAIGAWLGEALAERPGRVRGRPVRLGPPGPERDARGTGLTCPECGGVLFEQEEELTRYRCSVGHAFSPESLLFEQGREVEYAIWLALRSLANRAELLERIAVRSERAETSRRLRARAGELHAQQRAIRRAAGFELSGGEETA